MKRLAGLVLSVLVLGSVSQAELSTIAAAHGFTSDEQMKQYLTISSVRLIENPVETRSISEFAATLPPTKSLPSALTLGLDFISSLGPVFADSSSVSAWVTLGAKAWEIVVANKPVVNVSSARISVMPTDSTLWSKMSGWHAPIVRSYSLVATNLFGIEVVKQTYTVAFNYGGQVNGQGAYLANATIIPSNITVAWGYTLNASVTVGTIVNMGTVESPIPAVELQLKRSISTILKQEDNTDSFYVQGNGTIRAISN